MRHPSGLRAHGHQLWARTRKAIEIRTAGAALASRSAPVAALPAPAGAGASARARARRAAGCWRRLGRRHGEPRRDGEPAGASGARAGSGQRSRAGGLRLAAAPGACAPPGAAGAPHGGCLMKKGMSVLVAAARVHLFGASARPSGPHRFGSPDRRGVRPVAALAAARQPLPTLPVLVDGLGSRLCCPLRAGRRRHGALPVVQRRSDARRGQARAGAPPARRVVKPLLAKPMSGCLALLARRRASRAASPPRAGRAGLRNRRAGRGWRTRRPRQRAGGARPPQPPPHASPPAPLALHTPLSHRHAPAVATGRPHAPSRSKGAPPQGRSAF